MTRTQSKRRDSGILGRPGTYIREGPEHFFLLTLQQSSVSNTGHSFVHNCLVLRSKCSIQEYRFASTGPQILTDGLCFPDNRQSHIVLREASKDLVDTLHGSSIPVLGQAALNGVLMQP